MVSENNSLANLRSKFIKNIQTFTGGKIVGARIHFRHMLKMVHSFSTTKTG